MKTRQTKEPKLSKLQFYILLGVMNSVLIYLVFLLFDTPASPLIYALRTLTSLFFIFLVIAWIADLLCEADKDPTFLSLWYLSEHRDYSFYAESNESNETIIKPKKRISKWWGLTLIPIALYFLLSPVFSDMASIYNTSKKYHNTYKMTQLEKKGFYDKLWKTYLQKEKIASINKDIFVEVATMIMENRGDGSNVMWKWIQENQQIPFDEYTKFYADLSDFITSQRESYFQIEKKCQLIANQNNTLLDTFPNNLYNKILSCKQIEFEYGFLSDSTNHVFDSKTENIK